MRGGKELVIGWQKSCDSPACSAVDEPKRLLAGDGEDLEIVDAVLVSRKVLEDVQTPREYQAVLFDGSGSGNEWVFVQLEHVTGVWMCERDFLRLESDVHDGMGEVMPDGSVLASTSPAEGKEESEGAFLARFRRAKC